MEFFEAIEDLCAMDGPLGEAATTVLKGIVECGHGIADALDDFTEELRGLETELRGEDGEGSCCASDRQNLELESTPGLKATRDTVDSIVNFCDKTKLAINEATDKVMEMSEKVQDRQCT